MAEEFRDYKRYVTDADWAATYSAYQQKYAVDPRESDKKSARLVLTALREMQPLHRAPRILDIGCSTGNFLRHLKHVIPDAALFGGDLMMPAVEECRRDPTLAGIQFDVMDVFAVPNTQPFDVIVTNAVNVYFEPDEYRRAVKSIADALQPGGAFIAYEWVYEDEREQRIIEKSLGHPEGLKFWFRSPSFVGSALNGAGFDKIEIETFDIPIDLPPPVMDGTDAELMTYTVKDPRTGRRLMFRGALQQPWAHIMAIKQ